MILVSRNRLIRYMRIFAGVPGEGCVKRQGVVEARNFYRLLLVICSETLDRMCRIYRPIQDIRSFDGNFQ